jgi:hypothetical protein
MGLQVVSIHAKTYLDQYKNEHIFLTMPYSVVLACPVCKSRAIWIVYRTETPPNGDGPLPEKGLLTKSPFKTIRIYRIAAIPPEGKHEIPELPENPAALRIAHSEAVRCLDNNCPMAAAAMFRRALQIITRDVLGAKHGKLATELASLVGKENKLGVVLTTSFNKCGYILREVGNQAAHPDGDPDLLSFTHQDAQDLYDIFLKIVAELFVAPVAAKKATEGLMTRRKLQEKPVTVHPKKSPPNA